jgi:hypothetical protein
MTMIDDSVAQAPGTILVIFGPFEIRPHYRVNGCAHSKRGSHNTISKAGNHTSLREAEACAAKVKSAARSEETHRAFDRAKTP